MDRPGDPHARVDLLQGPARRHQLLVQQQVAGGREPVHHPVGDDPVAVALVAGQQVDPSLVTDGAPVGQDQLPVAPGRVGEVHLEGVLDLDGGEAVHARRPLEVAPQQRLGGGQLLLTGRRPAAGWTDSSFWRSQAPKSHCRRQR